MSPDRRSIRVSRPRDEQAAREKAALAKPLRARHYAKLAQEAARVDRERS